MNSPSRRRDFLKLGAGALVAACVPAAVSAATPNVTSTVRSAARRAGVPQECVDKLTNHDAAAITSWANRGGEGKARHQRKIREYIKKICRTR